MNKLREIFTPDSEYNKRQMEHLKEIIKQSYEEKWCCTCKNYIPENHNLPGFITTYPECKLGGLAIETCLFYNVKEDNNENYRGTETRD